MRSNKTRVLFMMSVLWGALIFWLAPHPPMIDLPQHAAQVALLRDMLMGQSPWAEFFRINFMTPYIIGYGLALPLSFFMQIAAALKLLLSLAYIAFVGMCVLLRRHYGADPRLDWLFLPSFFGFAYIWGFFTFLVAAPIGLWFILLADRYASSPNSRRALGLAAVGLLMLVSHGLVFLFASAVGGVLLMLRSASLRAFAATAWPYAILLLACAGYFVVSQQMNQGMSQYLAGVFAWNTGPSRIPKLFIYTIGANSLGGTVYVLSAVVLLIILMPWLMGLRIDWQRKSTWIPFAMLLAVMLLVPTFALSTAYLYQRFALFLLPAYAWMFTRSVDVESPADIKPAAATRLLRQPHWGAALAVPLLVVLCLSILSVNTVRSWKFGRESADIDHIINALQPEQRAATVLFYQDSVADGNAKIYAHYPAWYQAEKQGLVDFNFAWFPPQIVRYRPEHLPGITPQFDWHPERYDWVKNRGDDYTYFFVRQTQAVPGKAMPQGLFNGAICVPKPLISRGHWTVFERRPCTS